MDKHDSFPFDGLEKLFKTELDLPSFSKEVQSALSTGKSMPVEGTNVVRVPFGIRQSVKKRPARPDTWATLVIPLQPLGSPPTPPQAA